MATIIFTTSCRTKVLIKTLLVLLDGFILSSYLCLIDNSDESVIKGMDVAFNNTTVSSKTFCEDVSVDRKHHEKV